MEKDKKKIKEPYDPKDTAKQPQRIDPGAGDKRESPVEGKAGGAPSSAQPSDKPAERQHLLDEDAQIDDETTI